MFGLSKVSPKRLDFVAGYHKMMPWGRIAEEHQLRVGEATRWVEITDVLRRRDGRNIRGTDDRRTLTFTFNTPALPNSPRGGVRGRADQGNLLGVEASIDFATAPGETVKTIRYHSDTSVISVYVPGISGDLTKYADGIQTFYDSAQARLNALKAAGLREQPLPKRIDTSAWIVDGWHFPLYDHRAYYKELEVLRLMGVKYLNPRMWHALPRVNNETLPGLSTAFCEQYGGGPARDRVPAWLARGAGQTIDELEGERVGRLFAQFQTATGFQPGQHVTFKAFDEPWLLTVDTMEQHPGTLAAFREYLKQTGVTAEELGRTAHTEIKPIRLGDVADLPSAKLFYHTEWFRSTATARWWCAYRGLVHQVFGDGVRVVTCTPYGGFYARPDWFLCSKLGAWDTHLHHYAFGLWAPTHSGMLLAELLRSSARLGQARPGALLAPSRGRSAMGAELTLMSAAMLGLEHFYLYDYRPLSAVQELASPRFDITLAVAKVFQTIAQCEDHILDGRAPKREVAILHSRNSELWVRPPDAGPGGEALGKSYRGHYCEKEMVYTALALNQIPADVLPVEEVHDRLDRYKVLYLTDPHLAKAARGKIEAWVRAGGTLFSIAGAASRDEYNQPSGFIAHLAGPGAAIEETVDQRKLPWHIATTRGLYEVPVLDKARWLVTGGKPVEFEVLARKERLAIPRSTVLARFSDKAPAAVMFPCGRGKVVHVAAALGLALAKTAAPRFLYDHKEFAGQRTFDRNTMEIFLYPITLSGATRPIVVHKEGVDAIFFESNDSALILLADYYSGTVERVDVEAKLERDYRTCRTLDGQALSFRRRGARTLIKSVPLAVSQAIMLE